MEDIFATGFSFRNAGNQEGAIVERIAQLKPLQGEGFNGILTNFLRYVGLLGYQGFQIILIACGFILALIAHNQPKTQWDYRSHIHIIVRIGTQWFLVHLICIGMFIITKRGLDPGEWETWASLFGIRLLPKTMYHFTPSWWFFGLLLQLYLLSPLLFRLLKSFGRLWFAVTVIGGSIVIRLAGLLVFDELLDWWSRGALFISRLPEFAFGMVLADLYFSQKRIVTRNNRKIIIAVLLIIYLVGILLTFTLIGMSIAFLFTGGALFLLLLFILSSRRIYKPGLFRWCGKKASPLYLTHHPIILVLVGTSLLRDSVYQEVLLLVLVFSVVLCSSIILDWISKVLPKTLVSWKQIGGGSEIVKRLALIGIAFYIELDCLKKKHIIVIRIGT
jgi:peptidoglycan/LPS O-acetylase OafA/YrhL